MKTAKEMAEIKYLLENSKKEINQDLEVFKQDVRRKVQTRPDVASVILRKWLRR